MSASHHASPHRDVRKDLHWFHTNLKDQIHDRELEADGVTLEFFWDNSQVQRAVLGALDMFDPDFRIDKFDDPQTLVACLAAQGWLGTIKMLEPHQAEFARAFRRAFSREEPSLTVEQRETFFNAIALPGSEEYALSKLGRLDDGAQKALIAAYAGESERLFKGVQSAGGAWRSRLTSMYLSKALQISQSQSTGEYESIFRSEAFRKIRQELNQQRSARSENNVADAVCLCLLQEQVRAYLDNSRVLPRFYETTTTFRLALDRTDLLKAISYKDSQGDQQTVLRGSDYFRFRAAFTVSDDRVNSRLANLELATLRKLSTQIESILSASRVLRPEEVQDVAVGDYRIMDIIDDLRKLWVLERIWLPSLAKGDIEKLNAEERERLSGFRPDPEMSRLVEDTINVVTLALNRNVSAYERFREEYRRLDRHIAALPKDYEISATTSNSIYFVSGLVRFGIPDEYIPAIEGLLSSVLISEGEITREEACAKLARICISARTERTLAERTTAFALLWSLDMHQAIVEMTPIPGEARWNTATYAAACLRVKKYAEARQWIRHLEERLSRNDDGAETEPLATALSYLYFHLWRDEGGSISWRPDRPASKNRNASELRALADDCIRYAERAYAADAAQTSRRLYALNILLFYLTEAGTDQQFQRSVALANELMTYGGDQTVWQYRFDDTLARYFHRRSLLARDPEAQLRLWQSHKRYLKSAVDHNPGNPDVTSYAGIASDSSFAWESGSL